MGKKTKELTELTDEEKELINRLEKIRHSKKLKKLRLDVYAKAKEMGVIFKSRVKTNSSALKKFREKGYESADRMGDLLGMMFIAEDESKILELQEYMQTLLSDCEIEDYISMPKASGYRSLHMNDRIRASDINEKVPIEVQIKTSGMFVAQEATHETIYKNDELSKERKTELSAVYSPVMELLLDTEREIKNGNFEKALSFETQRKEMQKANAELLERYPEVAKETWKEYGKVRFKLEQYKPIDKEGFLKLDVKDKPSRSELEKAEKSQKARTKYFDKILDEIYEYYYKKADPHGNSSITGDPRSDYATKQLLNLDYSKFREILTKSYNERNKQNSSEDKGKKKITSKTIVHQILGENVKKSDVVRQGERLAKEYKAFEAFKEGIQSEEIQNQAER